MEWQYRDDQNKALTFSTFEQRSSELSRGRFFSGSPDDFSEGLVSVGCSTVSVTASSFFDAASSSCSRLRFFFGMIAASVLSVGGVSCV